MIETIDDINEMLENFGETLTFSTFSIKGIPGFDVNIISNDSFSYESQEFSFLIKTTDCVLHNLVKGNQFTFSDLSYNYIFKLQIDPISDLTNWSALKVDFISKTEI